MRRRFGADVVLAVVLPVACVLLLLVLHPHRDQPHGKAPVETALTSSSVICPDALPGSGADALGIASLGATGSADARPSGQVQVGSAPRRPPSS